MKKVASESYRVLKKDKFCAILMGDTRIKGHIQPLGFEVMKVFEAEGFKLKEIIIKEQHNCKATGYWKTNSIKYNFFLIAHEYLFVFKSLYIKPKAVLVFPVPVAIVSKTSLFPAIRLPSTDLIASI